VDRWHVPPARLRILCYTNALRAYLQAACPLLGLPPDCVETFHNWCRRQYEAAFPDRSLPGGRRGGPIFDEMVDEVRHAVRQGFLPEFLHAALVDEGQDLAPAAYEILARAAKHVTVALDYKQQIFEEGAALEEITAALGVRARDVALLEAFRCSPHLLQLAARFVDDAPERARLLAQGRTDGRGAETPLLFRAGDERAERANLAKVLKARLALGEHVGILVPTRQLVDEIASDLRGRGVAVEVPPPRNGAPAGRFLAHDFTGTAPKVMPYPSAKGLTFDSVLLPHLCSGAFRWYSAARLRKTLFVALTRARTWAYLGTVEGREASVLRDEGLLNLQPFLSVQGTRRLELFEDFVEGAEEGDPERSAPSEIGGSPPKVVRNDAIDDLL
jgi:hypothetical protein